MPYLSHRCVITISQFLKDERLSMKGVPKKLRGFWDAPAKQARLKGELQRILHGPDFKTLGPMWEKKATIISRIMEWSRRNHKLVIQP